MSHRNLPWILALLTVFVVIGGCKSGTDSNGITQPKALPIAKFKTNLEFWEWDVRYVPATIAFFNQSTYANTFRWDFGDGAASVEFNPTHTFQDSGLFRVCLTAYDSSTSDSDQAFFTIQLQEHRDPEVNFEWTGATIAPAVIQFINRTQGASQFAWDFSDGRTSDSTNPCIEFPHYGSFPITLVGTNTRYGRTVTARKILVIMPHHIFLDSIFVDTISFTDSHGVNWDPSDGPDLFYNIRDYNTRMVASSIGTPNNDMSPNSLPIRWAMPDSIELKDWDQSYRIELVDSDRIDADDIMAEISFSFAELIARSGYVNCYELTNSGFRLRMVIDWVE